MMMRKTTTLVRIAVVDIASSISFFFPWVKRVISDEDLEGETGEAHEAKGHETGDDEGDAETLECLGYM